MEPSTQFSCLLLLWLHRFMLSLAGCFLWHASCLNICCFMGASFSKSWGEVISFCFIFLKVVKSKVPDHFHPFSFLNFTVQLQSWTSWINVDALTLLQIFMIAKYLNSLWYYLVKFTSCMVSSDDDFINIQVHEFTHQSWEKTITETKSTTSILLVTSVIYSKLWLVHNRHPRPGRKWWVTPYQLGIQPFPNILYL